MPLRCVYRTADISALSQSLDSAEIFISNSVHKFEWHSKKNSYVNFDSKRNKAPYKIISCDDELITEMIASENNICFINTNNIL